MRGFAFKFPYSLETFHKQTLSYSSDPNRSEHIIDKFS